MLQPLHRHLYVLNFEVLSVKVVNNTDSGLGKTLPEFIDFNTGCQGALRYS